MLKRAVFVLVALVTLVALFFAEENWRGRRALERYLEEGKAKGERFDLESFVPPPVPDDQNMAMTPLLAALFRYERSKVTDGEAGSETRDRLPLTLYRKDRAPGSAGLGSFEQASRVDLEAWQEYYRSPAGAEDPASKQRLAQRYGITSWPEPPSDDTHATPLPVQRELEFPVAPEPQSAAADVLLALSRFEAEIAELHAAADRRHIRFPIRYDGRDLGQSLLLHLPAIKSVTQFFTLHAVAALANNRADLALADLRVVHRLMEGLEREPFLISFLVRLGCEAIALQPVWEGLADQRWNREQLTVLQQRFETADLIASFRQAIRGERAVFQIAPLVRRPTPADAAPDDPWAVMQRGFAKMPRGWAYQNQIAVYRLHQALIDLEPGQRRDTVGELIRQMGRRNPYTMMAVLLAPAFEKTPGKPWRVQTYLNLAAVACALERYRIEHGAYPEQLSALEPVFMTRVPLDFMSGGPLQYRRTADGRFVLYSVGEDRQDNGGAYRPRAWSGTTPPEHDWVWPYPLSSPDLQ